MLNDLFRLDGTPTILAPDSPTPPMSPGDTVRNIVFPSSRWNPSIRKIRGVTFCGVAFPKATLSQLTFTECKFQDCLFVATQFDNVEFHACYFVDCNFWKSRFEKVYLDPRCIKMDHRFKVEAANVGISVFQSLLSNFADERQDKFFMIADIQFRRWKRYQIWHDLRKKHITRLQAWWRWSSSIVSDLLAGYGYSPGKFLFATLVLFIAISWLNYWLIGDAVLIENVRVDHASFVDTVYYTSSILTVLSFPSVVPVPIAPKSLPFLTHWRRSDGLVSLPLFS